MRKVLFLLWIGCLFGFMSCTSQPVAEKAPQWKAKHVVLIGIDGWGSYSVEKAQIPNIRFLMDSGAYTLQKRAVECCQLGFDVYGNRTGITRIL